MQAPASFSVLKYLWWFFSVFKCNWTFRITVRRDSLPHHIHSSSLSEIRKSVFTIIEVIALSLISICHPFPVLLNSFLYDDLARTKTIVHLNEKIEVYPKSSQSHWNTTLLPSQDHTEVMKCISFNLTNASDISVNKLSNVWVMWKSY